MNRILTASEYLMWSSYNNSLENVSLSATVKGSFPIDLLTDALAWLQLRHSRLQVKIVTNNQNQPQFSLENVPPIPLQIFERQGEDLLAIATEVKPDNEIILRCHTPLNIRNYLTIPVNENLGEYITRPVTAHRLSQKTDFWDLAREVKYKLNQFIADGRLFDDVLKARALLTNNFNKTGKTVDSRSRAGADIAITNLGNLNIKQQFGKLQLQELYLMATGSKSLPLFIGVATLKDNTCFICRYQESLIPGANAHNIKNTAMEQLEAVCR